MEELEGLVTDSAERKVRQWATKRNGDPLTNQDVMELVFAFDDDNEARHEEVVTQLDTMSDDLDTVNAAGNVREERIETLERWRVQHEEMCAARLTLIQPVRRDDDSKDADYCDERGATVPLAVVDEETKRRVWVIWGVALFVGATLGAALLQDAVHALTRLLTGG